MIYYALRHKPTNTFFPQFYSYGGQTHYNFESWGKRSKNSPRLWTSLRSIKGWLTVYCKGPVVVRYEQRFDFYGNDEGRRFLDHEQTGARKKDDFEIVEMKVEPV